MHLRYFYMETRPLPYTLYFRFHQTRSDQDYIQYLRAKLHTSPVCHKLASLQNSMLTLIKLPFIIAVPCAKSRRLFLIPDGTKARPIAPIATAIIINGTRRGNLRTKLLLNKVCKKNLNFTVCFFFIVCRFWH